MLAIVEQDLEYVAVGDMLDSAPFAGATEQQLITAAAKFRPSSLGVRLGVVR